MRVGNSGSSLHRVPKCSAKVFDENFYREEGTIEVLNTNIVSISYRNSILWTQGGCSVPKAAGSGTHFSNRLMKLVKAAPQRYASFSKKKLLCSVVFRNPANSERIFRLCYCVCRQVSHRIFTNFVHLGYFI